MKRTLVMSLMISLFTLCSFRLSAVDITSEGPATLTILSEPLLKTLDARFLGSERCRSCHPGQYEHWQGTPHASAWDRVSKNGDRLSCARCHATGTEYEGGFRSAEKTPSLLNVQCEACHGPAEHHVRKREQAIIDDDYACGECDMKKVCITCHTISRSPHFVIEQAFQRISHPK